MGFFEGFTCPACKEFFQIVKPFADEMDGNDELFKTEQCPECGVILEHKWAANVYLVYTEIKKESGDVGVSQLPGS